MALWEFIGFIASCRQYSVVSIRACATECGDAFDEWTVSMFKGELEIQVKWMFRLLKYLGCCGDWDNTIVLDFTVLYGQDIDDGRATVVPGDRDSGIFTCSVPIWEDV